MSATTSMDSAPDETPEDKHASLKLNIGFFAMITGMFMAILDIQIVASSIRQIQAGVSASAEEVAWIQTGYLIAEVVGIPLSGFLIRVVGMRKLFAASAGGFVISSLLCALSWDLSSLVFFRVIQGFVGSAMVPITMTAAFTLFPGGRSMLQQVAIGMVATLAPSIGPTLGGWITEHTSWHWLFMINVVPGILAIIAVWICVPKQKADIALLKRLDIYSLVAMGVFLGTLEWVVEEGPAAGWFTDGEIVRMAVVCAVACGIFFWRALSVDTPAVDLRVFKNPSFASGALAGTVIGFGLYGGVYALPLFLGQVRGYSAMQIGGIMSVTGVAMFLFGPATGMLMRKMDPRILVVTGLLVGGAGVWMNGQLTAQSGFAELFWPQFLRGAGIMLTMVSATNIAISTLPPDMVGNATSLFTVCRNLGGAFGIAVMNTQLQHYNSLHLQELSAGLDPSRPEVQSFLESAADRMRALGVPDPEGSAMMQLGHMVQTEASVMTYNNLFQFMAFCFLGATLVVLFMKRPPPQADPPGPTH